MIDAGEDSQSSFIADTFVTCLALYREFYFYIAIDERHVRCQVDLVKVSDEYGRLNVWGSDSGALRSGRGSLDDALRHDENLKSTVLDILNDLIDAIKRAISASENQDTADPADQEGAERSDDDSLSSVSTSSENSIEETKQRRPKKTEYQYIISSIFEQIRSLYKISALLRRPTLRDNYVRSISKDEAISAYVPSDQAYVENKFRNAEQALVSRLAMANTRRRQQLKYWENHHQRETDEASVGPEAQQATVNVAKAKSKSLMGPEAKREAGELPTDRLGARSKITKQSFSTIAQSTINDNQTFSRRSQTVYEPTVQGKGSSLTVPDPPKVDFGRTSFQCPYCHASLEVGLMQDRHLWKEHVFRDLRPYVCTFVACPNGEKLYATRHDWLYHEAQLHQKRWICPGGCDKKFESPPLLQRHLIDHHSRLVTESQLPVLLDMSERPADRDEMGDCPLCGAELTIWALKNHVASHLEDLALFVLPCGADDQDDVANTKDATTGSIHTGAQDSTEGRQIARDNTTTNQYRPRPSFVNDETSSVNDETSSVNDGTSSVNDGTSSVNDEMFWDDISKHLVKGTKGDAEVLAPEFRVRKDHWEFFKPGQVFKTLFWEPQGSKQPPGLQGVSVVKYESGQVLGEAAFAKIYRYVVVNAKPKQGYSMCLRISTNGNRGTAKKFVDHRAHSIIYTSTESPVKLSNEKKFVKDPIRVTPVEGHSLEATSRVNFAKMFPVEHDTKVLELGTISKEHLRKFLGYWEYETQKGFPSRRPEKKSRKLKESEDHTNSRPTKA